MNDLDVVELGLEPIKNITKACQEASARSRTVLFSLNVACLLLFTAVWNATFSWSINVRERIRKEQIALRTKQMSIEGDPTAAIAAPISKADTEVRKAEADAKAGTLDKLNWNDLYMTTLPVFGIRYCADDMVVVGNMGLVIILVWLLFSLRRESHAMVRLDKYFFGYAGQLNVQKFLLESVSYFSIFNTSTAKHGPGVDAVTPTDWAIDHIPRLMISLVPQATSLFLLAATVYTQLVPQPDSVSVAAGLSVFEQQDSQGKALIIGLDFFGLFMFLSIRFFARRSGGFFKSTSDLLRRMQAVLATDPEATAHPRREGSQA